MINAIEINEVYLGSTNQNYLFEKDLNTLMEYKHQY